MHIDLLERDDFLLALEEPLRQAGIGHGQTVLISGEAGIGKTALIEYFLEVHKTCGRALWGACEALFTPRPLGPLYDIAQQAGEPLRAALTDGTNRATLFSVVLDELATGAHPTILVIEDIHWADEATLDLIKFLARRIHRIPALLLLTYREDEMRARPGHPLWMVLGDLPARDVTRLWLPPLSEAAVTTLARQAGYSSQSASLQHLYATTGGNPFFVTEVLASRESGVPASVRDAVLAQASRLTDEARRLLEIVAIVPGKVEPWVIEAVCAAQRSSAYRWSGEQDWNNWLEECLTAGILRLEEGETVAFRHELARMAMESSLPPARRRSLHAQVLQALLERGSEQPPLARLVHHASQAEHRTLVLRFAPQAAQQASAQGAHRAAATHYETALRYADALEQDQRAELLEALSWEYYLVGQMDDAMQPRAAALAIWHTLDRPEKLGYTLRQMSRLSWFIGNLPDAERYGLEAVEKLRSLPPNRDLAMAYGNLSHLYMQESDTARAILWGNRAIELAEQLHDTETLSYALNNVGAAEVNDGDDAGMAKLERSLALALEGSYEEHVARGYANLVETYVGRWDYQTAQRYIAAGIAYCNERDLGNWEQCLRGQQAMARLEQGDWPGADEDATAILKVRWAAGTNRGPALCVLGQLRVRRGDPGVEAVLDEAYNLAMLTGELGYIVPMSVARAEWHWLQGRYERCAAEATVGLHKALEHHDPRSLGETAFWVWRGGGQLDPRWEIPAPYALQMAGDWHAAADTWEALSRPYERAMALIDGDEAALRQALEIFEQLDARPAADLARRRLRLGGARGLPRGPRATTRENPYGLTNRQLEILLLLAEGLRNTEIAERLSTTPKTAAHHVSDILAKLQVRSRAEAVSVAHHIGIVPQMTQLTPASSSSL